MNKRLISLILAALMVLPTAACGSAPGAGADTTEAPAETAAPVSDLVLIGEGAPSYTIVRGDNAKSTEVDLAIFLRKYLQGSGMETKVTTDWEKNPVSDYELVVGDTTRIPADEGIGFTLRDLGEEGWFVKVSGQRIYMAGGSPESTRLAVEHFLTEFCGYTGTETSGAAMTSLSIPGDYEHVFRQSYPISALTLGGKSLGEYRILVTSTDVKARDAAEKLQSGIYASSGIWVEIVGKYDTWDGPTILFSDEAPKTSCHF